MQNSLHPRMFWSFGEPKNVSGWGLSGWGFGGGILGGYGDAFSRIGKGREALLSSTFWGGIRNVSFSQCSAVTWDSVIDCGGAC